MPIRPVFTLPCPSLSVLRNSLAARSEALRNPPLVTVTASLLLGALLGLANAAAALVAVRRAQALEPTPALRVVMVGMMIRLPLLLAAFAAVLAWVPVARGPFVIGLGVAFVAGLLAEAFFVLRRPVAA